MLCAVEKFLKAWVELVHHVLEESCISLEDIVKTMDIVMM